MAARSDAIAFMYGGAAALTGCMRLLIEDCQLVMMSALNESTTCCVKKIISGDLERKIRMVLQGNQSVAVE